MKTTILPILALASFVFTAKAHIGETFEQCVIRYGDPLAHDGSEAVFRKNGFTITTTFDDDGTCGAVVYRKGEKNAIGGFEELSEVEIDGLLASNAKGWGPLKAAIISKNYISGDSKVMAVYGVMDHELQLCTIKWYEKLRQKQSESQKSAVQGL